MAFWSSEKLKKRLSTIVDPYDSTRVTYCGYELSLGPEAFITSDGSNKTFIPPGGTLSIPPGQFGLLLTEETITVPDEVIGFISVKASVKFRGLVNVSGFHVDPGFRGRLKFSVYNAGGQNIVLSRGKPVFILWFADLDHRTEDVYKGNHNGQKEISSEDIMLIQGEVASPAALKKQFENLRNTQDHRLDLMEKTLGSMEKALSSWKSITTALIIGLVVALFSVVASLFLSNIFDRRSSVPPRPDEPTASRGIGESTPRVPAPPTSGEGPTLPSNTKR